MVGNGFRETYRYHRRMKQLGDDYLSPVCDFDHSQVKTVLSDEACRLVKLNKMTAINDISFRSKTRILTNGEQILLTIKRKAAATP